MAVVATPTVEELEARLDEHPELLARLKSGDYSAFDDILRAVGGATVGDVKVILKPKLDPADVDRLEKDFIRRLRGND